MADFEYTEVEMIEHPSKTYRLDIPNKRILGKVDDLEAIKQAVYLRLNTEKEESLIYSEDYGIQLKDLFGEPNTYVLPTLQRRISEALLQDERVLGVNEFYFTEEKGSVTATFTVHTVWGDMVTEKEVDY